MPRLPLKRNPSAPPEPAPCRKCHACHAKCMSMSPSAGPMRATRASPVQQVPCKSQSTSPKSGCQILLCRGQAGSAWQRGMIDSCGTACQGFLQCQKACIKKHTDTHTHTKKKRCLCAPYSKCLLFPNSYFQGINPIQPRGFESYVTS